MYRHAGIVKDTDDYDDLLVYSCVKRSLRTPPCTIKADPFSPMHSTHPPSAESRQPLASRYARSRRELCTASEKLAVIMSAWTSLESTAVSSSNSLLSRYRSLYLSTVWTDLSLCISVYLLILRRHCRCRRNMQTPQWLVRPEMNDHLCLAVLIYLTAARLRQQRLQAGMVGGLKFRPENHA